MSGLTQRLIGWALALGLMVMALMPTMTTVPSWWPIGAPIRLGLDLRGGTHLLYGVELDEAVRQSLASTGRELELALREAQVGAFTVDVEGDAIVVKLADRSRLGQARDLASSRFPDLVAAEGGGDLTLRLEAGISRAEALRIAASVR